MIKFVAAMMTALGIPSALVEHAAERSKGAVIRVNGRSTGESGGRLGPPPWSKRLKAKRQRARKAGR